MNQSIAASDLILSLFVIIGILQLSWFSVMILRRGALPETIRHALPPLLTIWTVMWPIYIDTRWLWAGIAALLLPSILAVVLKQPFWQHLRRAWSVRPMNAEIGIYPVLPLLPLTHLIVALMITSLWFQHIPEFGFGLALCLTLAFPLAYWVDYLAGGTNSESATRPLLLRLITVRLGFPTHPEQTLAGHLMLIAACSLLLNWSLHVYHGTDWKTLAIATLITALAASATRALMPGHWNAPAAMVTMGAVMWLL